MSGQPTSSTDTAQTKSPTLKRSIVGVLAGGGVLLGAMLLLAATAVLLGWIQHDPNAPVDLRAWLVLEVVGGGAVSMLAGWVCRHISRHYRAPGVLALAVFSIGLLEASEIVRHLQGSALQAPLWLVLLAPVVAALGILIGGLRRPAEGFGILGARFSAWWRYVVPVTVLLAATLICLLVLPDWPGSARTTVLAFVLTLDLTVCVPVLVYFVLVRTQHLPWIAVIPTIGVGYAIATVCIPQSHQGLLELMRLLVIPAELALVTAVVFRARRVFANTSQRRGDFVSRFRMVAQEMLGSRFAADIFATEVGVLYHAFGKNVPENNEAQSFTVHRKAGYLTVLSGLTIVLLVETITLHLVISQWSVVAAWLLTGLSGYALIWFVGDYRAFASRPIQLTPTHLRLFFGLRWEGHIAVEDILDVRVDLPIENKSDEALTAVVLGKPNLCLKLRRPAPMIGMYGIRKTSHEIWLQVDEPDALRRAISLVR